jgi:Na+-transporting NADH:ubiquinone oxidoreductase subunit NqrD
MDEKDKIFPGLRRGLVLIIIAVARLLRYVCYLLCAVCLYKLNENYAQAKELGFITAFVVTFIMAFILWFLEWKFTKNMDKLV